MVPLNPLKHLESCSLMYYTKRICLIFIWDQRFLFMHWCDVKWGARGQGGYFPAIDVLWIQCVLLLFYAWMHVYTHSPVPDDPRCWTPIAIFCEDMMDTATFLDAHWAINNLHFFWYIETFKHHRLQYYSFFMRVCPLNAVPEKNRHYQLSVRKLRSHQFAAQSSGWIQWMNKSVSHSINSPPLDCFLQVTQSLNQ